MGGEFLSARGMEEIFSTHNQRVPTTLENPTGAMVNGQVINA
jgi:hypothetical protein